MTDKAVQSAIDEAKKLVTAVHADARMEAFVEDGMFFLTAEFGEGEERRSVSHAYTLDSMQPAELRTAARELADRVLAELG